MEHFFFSCSIMALVRTLWDALGTEQEDGALMTGILPLGLQRNNSD